MFDYLVIGHVTRDRRPAGGVTGGGTAAYAALTARALGGRVGVVTSTGEDLHPADVLPGIEILHIPAPVTTTFENRYTSTGRVQMIRHVAAPLIPAVIPSTWRQTAIVHIGPVAQECDPELIALFPDAFVGLTPQGWMRGWDRQGTIHPVPWEHAERWLPHTDAVVLSEEDVRADPLCITRWAGHVPALAVTRGAEGCTVYGDGAPTEMPGFPAGEVDPTGAGDVFAAAFFHGLQRGWSAVQAARRANCLAAGSVTRAGLSAIPTAQEIADCRTTELEK